MDGQCLREQKLSEEILEAQKMRSEFLRWKLVLCAALGGAALGLSSGATSRIVLLALIPLACAYVDLLCTNINLRMILIGRHLADRGDPYELHVAERRIVFSLEDWALFGSTYTVSLILILLALGYLVSAVVRTDAAAVSRCYPCGGILAASVVGMVLTRWTQQAYHLLSAPEPLAEGVSARQHFTEQLCRKNRLFKLFVKIFIGGVGLGESAK